MKKIVFTVQSIVFVALFLVSFILLGGCSSQEAEPAKKRVALECAFPDTPDLEAPTWVCDFPFPGVKVSAVGSHKSKAGPSFAKDQAIADAYGKLAASLRTHVKKMIKRFVETTGTGDAETVDAVYTAVSKQITKETLYGTEVYRSITNPDTKRIYVLVGLNSAEVTQNAKEAIQKARTSMNDSRAEYQKNLSKESLNELENEAGKLNDEVN